MKKVIVSLVVFFSLSLLAGCATEIGVNPISTSSESVVEVNFSLEKVEAIKALYKTAAIDKPTILVALLLPDYKRDTIVLSGSGPIGLKYVLKKGFDYELGLSAVNPVESPNCLLNYKNTLFTVPGDKDTFSLDITLPAIVSKLDLEIPLEGSVAATTAKLVKVIWTTDNVYFDSSFVAFTPGSLDTVKLAGLLAVNRNYFVTVLIECSDGSYYKGMNSVTSSPSVDSNLDISLTKYDPNGVVVLTNVVLSKIASIKTRVIWP